MKTGIKRLLCLIVMIGLVTSGLFADAGAVVSFPYFGDVGIKNEGGRYTVALGSWGTWAAKGHFNNQKDYKLTTAIPVDNFIGYIPVAGQVLGVLGLSTVELTIQPSGVTYSMICEAGGLGLLRGTVSDCLSAEPTLRMVVDTVISGLEIKSLVITGAVISKDLRGAINGELSVIGKTVGFSGDGALSLKGLIDVIVGRILPTVKDYAATAATAVYKEAKGAAMAAGRETANMANYAYDQARQGAHNVTASVKHGTHSAEKCMNECVPNYANSQRGPMADGSNKAIRDFLDRLRPTVLAIEGSTTEETAVLRFAQFDAEWYQLLMLLDQKWLDIFNDREVDNYFFKEASERAGRDKFRGLIRETWVQHEQYRENALHGFLLAVNPRVSRPKKSAESAMAELAAYAKAGTPVLVTMRHADLAWNLVPTSKFANGSNVNFERLTGEANQQWIFVSAGKSNLYHIKSAASGRFIHISGAADAMSSSLVSWDGAGAPQTVFRVEADSDGCIRLYTTKGFAFDLESGSYEAGRDLRLWERNGSDVQAFYLSRADVKTISPFRTDFNIHMSMLARYAREGTPVAIRSKMGTFAVDLILDPATKQSPDGYGITFYSFHGQPNQQWKLEAVPGKPDSYHFKSVATGKYIHIAGGVDARDSALLIWSGAGKEHPQTYYRASVDASGFVHFHSASGKVWDLRGGQPVAGSVLQLYDQNGGDGQALMIMPVRQ